MEPDDINANEEYDVPPPGLVARFAPAAVVVGSICGFVALAWYAYHAGTQSLNEEDLLLVEADKTPVKEKPLEPGGMQFPNQDKTIFETFAAKGGQAPAKVERVLPPPEEPISKQANSDTTTWVNEKLHADASATATAEKTPAVEQVIGDDKAAKKPAMPEVKPADNSVVSYSKSKAAPAAEKPAVPASEPVATTAAKPTPTPAPAKTAAAPASGGKAKIQLGAYRSEKEAQSAWSAMQKKYAELSGKTPIVVKADLGEKGTYYRLRVGGFADAAAAKSFCAGLSAKGQACILSSE